MVFENSGTIAHIRAKNEKKSKENTDLILFFLMAK